MRIINFLTIKFDYYKYILSDFYRFRNKKGKSALNQSKLT